VGAVRSSVPWWALASSAAAPVTLIGGWTLAARRQPGRFDSTVETISALAARGAADRWLMTAALLGVGVLHVVTALGLSPAATAGRLLLGLGGVATALVAAFPLPITGAAPAHAAAAGTAFVALAAWPALAWRQPDRVAAESPPAVPRPGHVTAESPPAVPRPDRVAAESPPAVPRPDRVAAESPPAGRRADRGPVALRPAASVAAAAVLLGLVARFAVTLAGAQACWPLAVVLSARLRTRRAATTHAPAPPG
jgi:hypothetical protein